MKRRLWLKRLRLFFRIKSFTKSIRDYINSMSREDHRSQHYEENKRKIIEKIIELADVCQEFLSQDKPPPELENYEEFSPEDVDLSLSELLVLFRRTLVQLQETPPKVQENAIGILYSYFIELQGLYDLIFVSKYASDPSIVPLSPSSIEDHHTRYFQLPEEIAHDPLIQEYRSIQFKDLMNVSGSYHLHVVFFDLLPHFIFAAGKEFLQRKSRCRGILSPEAVDSLETFRAVLTEHPLTETAKLQVALHRHIMRLVDILGNRIILRLGRPIFELLVLATWCQTIKDHIVPGIHKPDWRVEHLDVEREVIGKNGGPGKIKMSSAFFMQPRVKFRLEKFLIFKNRTMTVGDVVRVHELGNWMRQNSPDEFLQFFNVALGDMGGLGVRTMPEHEIRETKETLWLYGALTSFVPGGMTSPGSIIMRKTNYGLTKAEQLLQEIRFYDPRFKGSSSLFTDLAMMFGSVKVLNRGRVGKALEQTESFEGKKRGY